MKCVAGGGVFSEIGQLIDISAKEEDDHPAHIGSSTTQWSDRPTTCKISSVGHKKQASENKSSEE